MSSFTEIKGNFGFGCMRLPMAGEKVETAEMTRMVDAFLDAGFNYFDTATVYLGGESENALRECLTSRYPRERYVLTDKLSGSLFEKEEDIRPLLDRQLAACGVDYFDFYLMHAQGRHNYEKYKRCRAYETAFQLKAEGKVRHVGLSFHDRAEVLDRILTDYPQVEVVQLQFNYLDYEDHKVESRKCYEVCRKHGKSVIVMEPVKGGRLAALSDAARAVLDPIRTGSDASYAIRFAAGFEGIIMVLSGMGSMAMMEDNLSYMKDFKPLSDGERAAVEQVAGILRQERVIPCTGCRYCVDGCPQAIPIPETFARLNALRLNQPAPAIPAEGGSAADCVQCGACEEACPQHLPIRDLLKTASRELA